MRVEFTEQALEQLSDIIAYLRQRNPAAASRVAASLRTAMQNLERHPRMGREQSNGSRKLVVGSYRYIVYYGVNDAANCVSIFAILHPSRERSSEGL